MKNKYSAIFNVLTVVAYFYGVVLCATLVLLPIGIYSIIAAHRYSDFVELSPAQLVLNKKNLTVWITFGCVLYFPLGLIGLIPLVKVKNNKDLEDLSVEATEQNVQEEQPQQFEKPAVEVEIHTPTTQAEKEEKLAKLERFLQNGLITQEEFDQAKQQLENKE